MGRVLGPTLRLRSDAGISIGLVPPSGQSLSAKQRFGFLCQRTGGGGGRVRLPVHLDWSTGRVYDLTDPADRRRVYEVVLREGSAEDLRRYIDARDLAAQFDKLVLPMRSAWPGNGCSGSGRPGRADAHRAATTCRAARDLDYFATACEAVADVLPILEVTFRRDGLAVVRRRDAPGFVRLEVTDEAGQVIEVDLAYAWLLPAQSSRLGPVLQADELAADKVLALYGRAEGRDFHDVAALARRYPTERLLELAASKDRGFDRRRFTETLASIGRLRDADFPDPQRAEELRRWFEHWRWELAGAL